MKTKLLITALTLSLAGFAHADAADFLYKYRGYGVYTSIGYEASNQIGSAVQIGLGAGAVVAYRWLLDAEIGRGMGINNSTNGTGEVERVMRSSTTYASLGGRYALTMTTDLRFGVTAERRNSTLETGTVGNGWLTQTYTDKTVTIIGGRLGVSRQLLPGLSVFADAKLRKNPGVNIGLKWGF